MDLSVLIPARNEQWLARTVADVLEHVHADTEVLVGLDGAWADPGLVQHPRLTVVKLPSAIGQRAATNMLARMSTSRYVMKLDAHCSVADGFDAELIRAAGDLGEDATQIPAQKNLHVYSWVCACGWKQYQGVRPAKCPACEFPDKLTQEIVWQPKRGSTTTCWRFDTEPKFNYWTERGRQQKDDICDVMTSLGACFFMSRRRFLELGGLDESHGSWGSFGIEVALKSWLSGGRHVVNRRTWFAHFFRVGGIGFPYPISGQDQERARERARTLWYDNQWPGQVRPLSWVIEKFAPIPDWHDPKGAAVLERVMAAGRAFVARRAPTAGIVYYSDCRGDADVLEAARDTIAASGLPIVSVTLQPVAGFGQNVVMDAERGYLTMFRQILAGLEALDTDVAFLCEHDVLYHPSHFAFRPARRDCYYYNEHVWKVDAATGRALTYRCNQTSGLCADRQLLLAHYRARVARVEAEGFTRRMGFEPGTRKIRHGGVDDVDVETWRSDAPNVDIRHGQNLTPSRWRQDQFRDQRHCQGWQEADAVPGWGVTLGRFRAWLADTREQVAA